MGRSPKFSLRVYRKSFLFKVITTFTALTMLFQVFYPTVAMAITGGPTQPEMQGFEPIGTTNMVDLSSGGFTYNIPLMDVEGYPINLSYHSGITMDQEASWVGLGWNINAGEINRQMRGLPDDFQGDTVTQSYNMRDNVTTSLDVSAQIKAFGIPIPLGATAGVFYNNYKGPGLTFGLSASLNSGDPNNGCLTGSLGLNFNSQSGLSVSPSIGFSQESQDAQGNSDNLGVNVGTSYNSRSGIKSLSVGADAKLGQGSLSTHVPISFAYPSFTPTMSMPLSNYSITLDATMGLALFGTHPNVTFSGSFNDQTLATHTLGLPAYGYMYADYAKDNPYALHDFNREKDVAFQQHIANLPITSFTYDLFSINGQGVDGQFRPFRGDVGVLYDHECSNVSLSGSVGLEFGLTELTHVGIQLGFNYSNTTTDKWTSNNDFGNMVDFIGLQAGNINYEPFYIKNIGEKTVNDAAFYNSIANDWATRVHLDWTGGSTVTARNIFDYANSTLWLSGNLMKTRREKRNQSTSIMNAQEANFFGLDKTINSYPMNRNVFGSCTAADSIQYMSRMSWPNYHMSEITVTNPDGKRYVYGIPAYNTLQQEVTFAVNTGLNTSTSNYYQNNTHNLVAYDTTIDNSIGNNKGLDNYFNQQQIPSYSHSFLLTGILSPDYVDLTNNGITDDDLGEAVKINYTQLYSKASPFQWRTPFERDSANYQVGLMSDNQDDKANYTFGKKEIWYVHSIESKTMVAQFILQPREDAYGVRSKNGGIDLSHPLECIKEINLYSKADLIQHGSNAVPIKTVHFEYDYSQCPGTPNSNATGGGKLTLKCVYFTYGNNTEGSLNSYHFGYSKENPKYSHSRFDRWGYYKNNPNTLPPNQDFLYTLQNPDSTNLYATAWDMDTVHLPSGGQITVQYESNDYGYVQNQRAGQMCMVTGLGANSSDSTGTELYTKPGLSAKFNNWVFVRLPQAISNDQDFYNKYLSGVDSSNSAGNPVTKLYFRFLVNIGNLTTPTYEYVPGYCDIASGSGTYKMVNSHLGAIELNSSPSGDPLVGNVNPIAIASWQFLRLNRPQVAYPGSSLTGSPLSVIEFLLGIIPEVIDIALGFDDRAIIQNFGRYVVPSYSYLRLDNPDYKKLGGGTRVKEIDISDNWSSMASGQSSFQYGQTFAYTTTLPNGQVISSGVATYEPIMGGDENPLRQPLPYSPQVLLAPNNSFYTETPLGESLYPSPGVVYSKVTVTNLKNKGVSRTGTGHTVNEFYTAKDFPVVNNWTDMTVDRVQPSVLQSIFNIGVQDFMTTSQGFVVEVNDMAGKQKGQEVYDQNSALISSEQDFYNVDNPSAPIQHLNNDVQAIDTSGNITTTSVGEDIDVWEDMREQNTITMGIDQTLNNEDFIIPFIIPINIYLPIALPSLSSSHTRFRSAVTTKYIHRTGLLDHTVKTINGSQVTTQNLLYDGETGEVLLTQTNNEFNKPVYNFTYPAHWAYDGMGSAYRNIGFEMTGMTTTSTGAITSPSNPSAYFAPGDELEYFVPTVGIINTKAWIAQPKDSMVVMNSAGKPVVMTNNIVKVLRSGRRNMPSTPIGTIQSLNSPINNTGTGLNTVTASLNVLQASGSLFNNQWQVPVNNVMQQVCTSSSAPPDSCIVNFFDSIEAHGQVYAKPSDSIKFGKYAPHCTAYANELYYAITQRKGEDQTALFQAQLGNCMITITPYVVARYGGRSGTTTYTNTILNMDSLGQYSQITYYRLNHITGNGIDDTTGGCINLYDESLKGYIYGVSCPGYPYPCDPTSKTYPLRAKMCISCTTCTNICTNLSIDSAMNPYTIGMLGNWRPERNYVYYDSRSPALASTTSNIYNTGLFNHFNPIWKLSSGAWSLDTTTDKNWTWTSRISKYDQKGNEIEDVDALGRYSSALYGYIQSLPVAVASNAQFKEIASDNFEDYGFNVTCNSTCDNSHFSFINYIADTTSAEAHTGKYSLKLAAGTKDSVTRSITNFSTALDSTTHTKFILLNGGNIPLFSPDNGSYLLSAWVKEGATCGVTGYTKDSIVVSYTGSSAKYVMKPSGPVIEGWQRFESRFKVPTTATAITVKLVAGTNTAYYDDIRIEPFAAEMKTYVYDPSSLRLLATLDENNYATIYEYNDEGILMRVKKETERGIMTIKESRSSYPRK